MLTERDGTIVVGCRLSIIRAGRVSKVVVVVVVDETWVDRSEVEDIPRTESRFATLRESCAQPRP